MKQHKNRFLNFTCWHSILPAFSARLIIALRTLLGIMCITTFTLSPITSISFQNQLLLGISFIVGIRSTLGATIKLAIHLFLGSATAMIYCLIIIHTCPRNVYFGIGATVLFVFLIVYINLPIAFRQISIVITCIILLQWFSNPHINTLFVLRIWTSFIMGATLPVVVTCIPLPVIPTAHRELTMRMRFIARQTRREITTIVLLISEYHNLHFVDNFDFKTNQTSQQNSIDENSSDVEVQTNSCRENKLNHHSTSFENLRDDHLFISDLQDLHSLVKDELKQMQRALGEISYEPHIIFLNLLDFIRRLLRHVSFIEKYIKTTLTLEKRLGVWSESFGSIQRTIGAMLTLDNLHHAFVGQKQLINAICILLESTFNFLDLTLPYTAESNSNINEAQIISCRKEVEKALEKFFETYTQARETLHHAKMSNTDSIHLNTFLLLILRLVHVTMTAAEKSGTPGAQSETFYEDISNISTPGKKFDWKTSLHNLAACIGIKPSFGKIVHSIKTSLSVLVSAVFVFTFRERLQAESWIYWAPMTTAIVSSLSESGTLLFSFQRLMAVLLGSTYAYVVILVAQNRISVGIFISLFVGVMGYLKTDPRKQYFATVCAQSVSIIAFLSNQEGQMNASNKTVLARTSLTFVGIFIHVLISNIFLPVTARALIKKKISIMIKNVSVTLKYSSYEFCSFIDPSLKDKQTSTNKTDYNLMETLAETEHIADSFPALLEEASNEPNFWKRPFLQVKAHYDDISKSLRRIATGIRFVHRCTTILKAELQLHFAQEAKWQIRQDSLAHIQHTTDSKQLHSWARKEIHKEQQLEKDLDLPLTIFMNHSSHSTPMLEQNALILNNSSASFRLANTELYQSVLKHIQTLEEHIQNVILLSGKLIEKKTTIDVGSFELHRLCQEDLYDEQQTLNRDPSFYVASRFEDLPMVKNHYRFFSCCIKPHEDHESLPSLRNAVDSMLTSLIEFLYANDRFMRAEHVSNQSIGDVLAFHTLSCALKHMVKSTTNLAKSARRIKHVYTRP